MHSHTYTHIHSPPHAEHYEYHTTPHTLCCPLEISGMNGNTAGTIRDKSSVVSAGQQRIHNITKWNSRHYYKTKSNKLLFKRSFHRFCRHEYCHYWINGLTQTQVHSYLCSLSHTSLYLFAHPIILHLVRLWTDFRQLLPYTLATIYEQKCIRNI